ncbi:hypothetical protein OSB04_013736 [Centaurea solstitialis]|uniref:Filament-like plant protein 3 n=1 Tax=Centaurea solstitialis TaxID=347529 RepID=A0AA38TWW0_9ASTR|nr:hypothetical protein OSB04_013736 [Centaurea solstitialis]
MALLQMAELLPEKMDRRSWLWRRKSSEKSPGETESSIGSMSSHSERFSDDQVNLNQNSQTLEVMLKTDQRENEHNHGAKTLSEKLSEALLSINAKEELVKQHAKVAEEAVSGWEKAESEVLALRKQVEALTARNSTLEDRVIHLDGALKECLRQLRQTREEKDQIALQVLEKKNSESESTLTSIDTELHYKLEMAEKENSDLKLELSSMAEELEIRLIEKELSIEAAEQASKLHLESVRKVAKFEAECRRLSSALQKANDHKSSLNTRSRTRRTPSMVKNNEIRKTRRDSHVEIDLMDDFLEMERLVAELRENELKVSRNRLKETEWKLAECENELKVSRSQLEESEIKLAEREYELKASRSRVEEAESKLAECENELKVSISRLEEAECNSAERENELKATTSRLEEAERKLIECESELRASRSRLEEASHKLAEHENELQGSKIRLEEAECKLAEREYKLMVSRNRLEEAEHKLAEHENELERSRNRLEEAESMLAERENELQGSRTQLEEARYKLVECENELNTSRNQLEVAESKLVETESRLEMAEAGLETTYAKREESKSRYSLLEAELEISLQKVKSLESNVRKADAKCRELEGEVSRLQHEAQSTKSVNTAEEFRFLRLKHDTGLAMAGSKFAECQKTIASLSRQLKTMATLDDFLIDTNDS